ncbi:Hypothetical predicted protein [Pelobates cultripes]|uniref:Uncharacterized protein n=1 Tax=Pelobates cultripes TaxID=61616 RepID=A0AAD1TD53_PELCU|nr:Hypothetical predicted protein [Pelobates cultripes]CAH2321758.1 Hypothetical predicted protein [Pelobates cultripes]
MKTAPHYPSPFVAQWLADCNELITDTEVLASPNALKGLTQCHSHIEAHKKLVYRWYLTPHRLHAKSAKCILALTALAVRNLIANQWKQPHHPSKTHLLTKIHQYHTYESMIPKTALQRKFFQESWSPWADYWDMVNTI